MKRKFFSIVVMIATMVWPAMTAAAPEPIPTVELGRGNVYEPAPHAAPDGGQVVTWVGQGGDTGVHLTERGSLGGPFAPPVKLSSTGNAEAPSISFTPDGSLYAIWGISSSVTPAESTTRSPGGTFGPAVPVPGCLRFVDSAAGPDGGVAAACRYGLGTNPPDTVRWASSPTLGPVPIGAGEDLTPAAYSNFLYPLLEWGPDGTIAIVSQGYTTTTNPPPANQTTRVRVSIRGSVPFYTEDIAFATWPQEVGADAPLVLNDGTVAVPLSGSAGARVMIRPPGAITTFMPHPIPGEGIWGAGLDSDQNIHVAAGVSDDRQYASYVKAPGSAFGSANPIPMPVIPSNGDAYLTGFEVAPDGTEYAIIRGDDGTYASSRSPGQAFTSPVRLGDASSGNPTSAVTRDGDLLITWNRENGPGDLSIVFSGLDKTPPAVTIVSFPESVADGQTAAFSATATDAMGIRSLEWDFGGTKVTSGDATHTFPGPGSHLVAFTATDVAGQKTEVERMVNVPIGPGSVPVMTLKAPKRVKFKALKKRGVRIVVTAQPDVRIRVVLGTSKKNARLRPMRVRVVKKFRGRHVLRVKPKRGRLGKRRSFRLYVQVTGTTAIGKQTTKARSVRVRK